MVIYQRNSVCGQNLKHKSFNSRIFMKNKTINKYGKPSHDGTELATISVNLQYKQILCYLSADHP
jgi:hypothetical protein